VGVKRKLKIVFVCVCRRKHEFSPIDGKPINMAIKMPCMKCGRMFTVSLKDDNELESSDVD